MFTLPVKTCSVEGCENKNYARTLCKPHYDKAKWRGDLPARVTGPHSFEQRFWEKVSKNGPIHPVLKTRCWVWTASTNGFGYGLIQRGARGEGNERAHRASWQLHCGAIPDGLCVLHRCDNPPCVNPQHLFLGTKLVNNHDMMAKGRYRPDSSLPRGEAHHYSKLTADSVREGRLLFHSGVASIQELADKNDVAPATMYAAIYRVTWQHVD